MKFTNSSVFNVFYCDFIPSTDADASSPIRKESRLTSVFFHPEKEKSHLAQGGKLNLLTIGLEE